MKRRAAALVAVAASSPAAAPAKKPKRHYVPGCFSARCNDRIGAIWAAHHPKPKARKASFTAPYRAWLRKIRLCESGGNYSTNTGNGFYGAYQFTLISWAAVGGKGRPDQAPPAEQDYRAVRLLKLQGPGAWPVCSQ